MLATAIRHAIRGDRSPTDDFWYRPASRLSSAGINVGDEDALRVATFWACLRVLSDTVGSMPWILYERIGDDRRRRATGHEFYSVIHERPNRWQSPMDWKAMAVGHLILRGNFYCRIDSPNRFWDRWQFTPLNPDRMQPEQRDSGVLVYRYTYENGEKKDFQQEEIFHVRLVSGDGIKGMSPLSYARETLGNTIAKQQHEGALFKGGGFLKYYLTTDKVMKGEALSNFRKGWRDIHGNPSRYEPPILEQGMDIKTLGMSSEDAQLLESRKFGAYEICQFLGVPPHLVFLLDRATFSNIEHQSIEFLTVHLNPWLVRFEQALAPFLEMEDNEPEYFSEFLRDAIVRSDMKTRFESYAKAAGGKGWMTINEVRQLENREPLEGGDELPPAPNESVPAREDRGGQAEQVEEPPDDTEDEQASRPNIEPLIVDVAERIVTREIKGLGARAGKAEEDRATWDEWAAEWYCRHNEFASRALFPVYTAAGQPGDDAATFADEYCRLSLAALGGQSVVQVLDDWKQNKAAAVADDLRKALQCMSTS